MFSRNKSPPPSPQDAKSSGTSKFTLPHLKNLHKKLEANKCVTAETENAAVEILRSIAEMVVYGDNKSELLFDFFCEKNMLSLFLQIMRSETGCPVKVHIQILQTLSILCQCVQNDTSLYYLLSNNYINDMLNFPHNFEDDELCDNFVSFMKSLSLRLNPQTVQFFFTEEHSNFPLLMKAIDFLPYREPMVRIAAQATILNVYRVADEQSRQYALKPDILDALCSRIVSILENQYMSLSSLTREYSIYALQPHTKELTEGKVGRRNEDQLRTYLSGMEDWLYYLQDLFGLRIPSLTTCLVDNVLLHYVYPMLLDPIADARWRSSNMYESSAYMGDVEAVAEDEASVCLTVSLFLLRQIFTIIREKTLLRGILIALLHPLSRKARKIDYEHQTNDVASSIVISPGDVEITVHSENDSPSKCTNGSSKTKIPKEEVENPYRSSLVAILQLSKERFTLLTIMLLESIIYCFVNNATKRTGSHKVHYICRSVKLLQSINVWYEGGVKEGSWLPLKNALNVELSRSSDILEFATEDSELNAELLLEATKQGVDKSSCSFHYTEDELDLERMSDAEHDIDIESPEPAKQSTHGDILGITRILELADISRRLVQLDVPLCQYLINSMKQMSNSLVTIQIAAFALHNMIHLAHLATLTVDGKVDIAAPYQQALNRTLKSIREAVKQAAEMVLARANSWLGDTLLVVVEDEIRRASVCSSNWHQTIIQMCYDALLLLPPIPTHCHRMGIEHLAAKSEVECTRRELQAFMLLRSLYKCTHSVLNNPNIPSAPEDLCKGLVDDNFMSFAEVDLNAKKYFPTASVTMIGRQCLPACIISPSLESSDISITPPPRTASMRLSRGASSSPVPRRASLATEPAKTPERVKKIGEVYFVLDETMVLVTLPDKTKLDKGVILLALPIHRTDASIDSTDNKHLRILVKSTQPLASMDRVTADNDVSSPMNDGPKLPNILGPRATAVLYSMVVGFESAKSCEMAAKHIETCKLRVRSTRLDNLRAFLNQWADISLENPEN